MSPARAAAIVPNALSFPRATMRELVRDRYRVEKLRFDLDAEGRGEILYRLVGGGWTFHFFLVSHKLPEAAKTDRNFAQSWDAMGVLCQGEWTAEREAHLRREVPKQRAGYADYDTLIYARGNRSARAVRPRRGQPCRGPPAGPRAGRADRLHPAHHGLHRQRPARHAPVRRLRARPSVAASLPRAVLLGVHAARVRVRPRRPPGAGAQSERGAARARVPPLPRSRQRGGDRARARSSPTTRT